MDDKKKTESATTKNEKKTKTTKPNTREIKDIDDLIFADEYFKPHSEK